MLGKSLGWSIVLAPTSDLLALVIAEGIEKVIVFHEATGLGAPGLQVLHPGCLNSRTWCRPTSSASRSWSTTMLMEGTTPVSWSVVSESAASRRTKCV